MATPHWMFFCPALPPDNVTKAVKMSLFLGSKTNRRFFFDQNPAQKHCVLHGKNVYSITLILLLQVSGPWARCRYCQKFSAMSFDPVLSLLLFRIPWGPDLSRLATLTVFCQKGTISLWQVSQRILSTDYCIITMHFNKGLEMNTGFAVIETPLMRVRLYRKLGLWRLNVKNHINMIFDI